MKRYCVAGLVCGVGLFIFFGHTEKARPQSTEEAPAIEHVDPPQFGFYAKEVNCGGVVIRGSALVEDRALLAACKKIGTILAQMNVTRLNLVQRGVELHIAGREQKLSELPEAREPLRIAVTQTSTGAEDSEAVRGRSGIYSACGAESLTAVSPNASGAEVDVCTREFAVALMNYGFDDDLRRLIETQYRNSIAAGHWKETPAAASPQDYWAELSVRYFASHSGFEEKKQSPAPGPDGLRQYDSAGFALLDLLYSGKKRPVAIEAVRARRVSKLALSQVNSKPAELQLVNNSGQRLRLFWIDTDGETRSFGEVGPYNRMIAKTFFSHVWMLEDQRGVEIQRFVVEDYVSEVTIAD